MNEFETGKSGFVLFFLLIIVLGVGGYWFVKESQKEEPKKENEKQEETANNSLKIDEEKPYIFKEVDSVLNEDIPIIYEYPIINLNSSDAINLNDILKTEINTIKNNVKYQNEVELENDEEILYHEGNIYSANVRDYEIYEFENYITLVVYDYFYYCTGKSGSKNVKSYTFDIKTGNLIKEEELLKKYNKTIQGIESDIRSHLTKELNKLISENSEMVNFIRITDTLNNLKFNETIIYYINSEGTLTVNFVVKTQEVDYNDSINF